MNSLSESTGNSLLNKILFTMKIKTDESLNVPVDLDFLRNITDHDDEFEKDLLKIFIESSKNDLKKMEDSLGNPQSNDWYLSAHSFKGSSSSIGAFPLAKVLEYAQFHKDASDVEKIETLKEIKEKLVLVTDFLTKEFFGY